MGVALKYVTARAELGMTGVDVSIFSSKEKNQVFDLSGYVDGRATEVNAVCFLSPQASRRVFSVDSEVTKNFAAGYRKRIDR